MLNAQQTKNLARSFYDAAAAGQNSSHFACILNLKGDTEFMAKLFEVRGFRELLAAALPPEQRQMGHLGK